MDLSKDIKRCLELQQEVQQCYATFEAAHEKAVTEARLLGKKLECAGVPSQFHEIIDGQMYEVSVVHDSTTKIPGHRVKATILTPLSQRKLDNK